MGIVEALDVIRAHIKELKAWGLIDYDQGSPFYAPDSQAEFEKWEEVLEVIESAVYPKWEYDV